MKRIGIIGCGLIADTHVESIMSALPGCEILVADPQPGKAELLRRKYNLAQSFTETEAMLEKGKPFAVHVCSPPAWHVRHARQAIDAGCHVLIEKPLGFSLEEARDLYAYAERAKRSVCVDHSLLFQPSVRRMKQGMEAHGNLPVLHLDTFYGMDSADIAGTTPPPEHWKHRMPGGDLMDSLVHPISLAIALAGSPSDVTVRLTGPSGQEQVKVIWKTETAVVSLVVSQGSQPFRRVTHVATSAATFIIDHSTEVLATLGAGAGPRALRKLATNISFSSQLLAGTVGTVCKVLRKRIRQNPGARDLICAFYKHLADGAPNPTSQADVLETTRVLEEIASQLSSSASSPDTASVPAATKPTSTVLITGASGFLGRALCRTLAEDGRRRIIAQVRRGANADRLPACGNIRKTHLDFDHFEPGDFGKLLDGVDEVVHCAHAAGAKIWTDYERRNITHTLALYEAAAEAGCKRFIHISSLAVYGVRNRGKLTLDENVPVNDGHGRYDFYIRSKSRAETALLRRSVSGGPPLLILRPGILYDAGGERLFGKSIPLSKGRLFICFGPGRNHLPYTRVDSVASLITRCLDMSPFPEGVFNLSGAQHEDFKTFLSTRCKAIGMPCRFLRIPAWPLRTGAWFLETLYTLTFRTRPPKLTRYVLNSATRNLIYDCSKATQCLGWDPDKAIRIPSSGELLHI